MTDHIHPPDQISITDPSQLQLSWLSENNSPHTPDTVPLPLIGSVLTPNLFGAAEGVVFMPVWEARFTPPSKFVGQVMLAGVDGAQIGFVTTKENGQISQLQWFVHGPYTVKSSDQNSLTDKVADPAVNFFWEHNAEQCLLIGISRG